MDFCNGHSGAYEYVYCELGKASALEVEYHSELLTQESLVVIVQYTHFVFILIYR